MKYALLFLLAFVAGCSGCVSIRTSDGVALRLEFEHGTCSGTAVGPDELLSAAHCFTGPIGRLKSVNGVSVGYYTAHQPVGDTVRVHIRKFQFKAWAHRLGKARQGDSVYWYGNPLGMPNMLRRGYVAGVMKDGVVISAIACTGDSGSGVFNERGELIAVVSRIASQLERCSGMMLAEPV